KSSSMTNSARRAAGGMIPALRHASRTQPRISGNTLMRAAKQRTSDPSLIAVLDQPPRGGAMSRILTALVLCAVAAASAAQQAGTIKIAKGTVAIERSGQNSPAMPGAQVQAGDRIVTGDDGQVGITLRDNTLLSAGPNSTLV